MFVTLLSPSQCMSGHILCKECHQRCEDSCPTCRRPLNGKIRSIVADKVSTFCPRKLNEYLGIFTKELFTNGTKEIEILYPGTHCNLNTLLHAVSCMGHADGAQP